MKPVLQARLLPLLTLPALGALSCQSSKGYLRGGAEPVTTPATTETTQAEPVEASAPAAAPKGMVAASMAYPTGDRRTSAILVEKIVPYEVQLGSKFSYETRVTNLTSMPLENVVVTESQHGNFTLANARPVAASTKSGSSWTFDVIPAQQSRSITVEGTAKTTDDVQSCVSVSYETALCTSIPVVAPALKLTAKGPASVIQCDDILYTYTVQNTGSGTARDVVVTGSYPEGLTTGGRSSFSKQFGDLTSGAKREFTVTAKASRKGKFQHVASARGAGDLEAESADVSTSVTKPQLTIDKKGTEKQFVDRSVKYNITVQNTGDAVAREVGIEDVVPSGAAFRSASDNGRLSAGKIRWNLGELKPGASRTVSVELRGERIGTLRSAANARAYCADTVTDAVETEVRGIPAILMEVVDLEDPIEVGSNETYVITVTNQGSAPATGVKVKIDLPENVSYVSSTGATKALVGPTPGRSFELGALGSLAPKGKATWRIVVRGNEPADARFRVSMTSDQLTSPVEETEATNFYE